MPAKRVSPVSSEKGGPAASATEASQAPSADCEVCCEKLNKSKNKPITCTFCAYTACTACCQTFILGSIREASCMSCKKVWGREFLVENFTMKFVNTEYKAHREKTFYDREKALLPRTQPLAEAMIKKQELERKIRELEEKQRIIKAELQTLYYEKDHRMFVELRRAGRVADGLEDEDAAGFRTEWGAAAATSSAVAKKKFIAKCPSGDCRGFLGEDHKCGLCGTVCCKKCSAVIPVSSTGEEGEGAAAKAAEKDRQQRPPPHECKQEDLETAALLKKDTKPCPSCGAMIHKIDGCNQMWCTQCHCAFDWKTGEIEKGNIHNPEYFRYLREKGGPIPRAPGDHHQQCERVDDVLVGRVARIRRCQEIDEKKKSQLLDMCRNIIHHRAVTLNGGTFHIDASKARSQRVDFLLGKICEQDFMATVQKREKSNEKKTEIRNVIEMLIAASSDIILRYTHDVFNRVGTYLNAYGKDKDAEIVYDLDGKAVGDISTPSKWVSFVEEMNNLVAYANERLEKVSSLYGCKAYSFSQENLSLNIRGGGVKKEDVRFRYRRGY